MTRALSRGAVACGMAMALWATVARAATLDEVAAAVRAWQPPAGVSVHQVDSGPDQVVVTLRWAGETVRALLVHMPPGRAPSAGVGEPLHSLLWLTDPRQPTAEWRPALAALRDHVARVDRGQFAVTRPAGRAPPPLLLTETWVLIGLSVPALAWALARAGRELPGRRRNWLAIVAAAWVLRAAAPHRLVMVHFGWLHLDQAAFLHELPRYGPATSVLDHALFWVTGPSAAAVQWMHTVLGALTVPLLAVLALRWSGGRPQAAWAAAAMVGAMPLLLLDHGSESMLVPAMLWWSAAVVCLGAALRGSGTGPWLAALVLLLLCALARPDCMLVGAPTALAAAWPGAQRPAWTRSWRPLVVLAGLFAVLALPDLAWLRDRTADDVALGNLPRLNGGFFADLPRRLAQGWVILDPRYFPLPILALAAFAAGGRSAGRAALAWGLALAWALPMLLDFNESSKLRLHVPSAEVVTLAAALGWADLASRLAGRSAAWTWAAGAAVVCAALWTVRPVFAPQNSDFAEAAVEAAGALAKDGKPTALVVRAYVDEPSFGVHLYWPESMLEPGDRWLSVADWQAGRLRPGERALGVLDVRCWAALPDRRTFAGMHPACALLDRARVGPPLWQAEVPNVGERGFSWYPPVVHQPSWTQRVVTLP